MKSTSAAAIVIAAAGRPPPVADQFEATLLWMGDHDADSRPFLSAENAVEADAGIGDLDLKHRVDVDSDAHLRRGRSR